MIELLGLSGSLRAASANTALLHAAAGLVPEGVRLSVFDGVGALPHFNPDVEEDAPSVALAWRERVGACDGVLIACPEYAHGIPGAFKNALDWVVGNAELTGKPVVVVNTSHRAQHAQAALTEVLVTMGWTIVAAPVIVVANRGLSSQAIASDAALAGQLRECLRALRTACMKAAL